MANIGSVTFQKDEKSTYEHMLGCLNTVGAEATFQTPPSNIGFAVSRSTGGFKYGCEGEVNISPLPDGKSNAVIRVRSTSTTWAYAIGSTALIGVVLWFLFRLALGTEGAIWGVVVAVAAGVGPVLAVLGELPREDTSATQASSRPGGLCACRGNQADNRSWDYQVLQQLRPENSCRGELLPAFRS